MEIDVKKFKQLNKSFSKAIPKDVRDRMITIYENDLRYQIIKALYLRKEPIDFSMILDQLDEYVKENDTLFTEIGKEIEELKNEKIIFTERGHSIDYFLYPLTEEAFRTLKILDKYYTQPIINEMKSKEELSDITETDLNNIGKIGLIMTLKDIE